MKKIIEINEKWVIINGYRIWPNTIIEVINSNKIIMSVLIGDTKARLVRKPIEKYGLKAIELILELEKQGKLVDVKGHHC